MNSVLILTLSMRTLQAAGAEAGVQVTTGQEAGGAGRAVTGRGAWPLLYLQYKYKYLLL